MLKFILWLVLSSLSTPGNACEAFNFTLANIPGTSTETILKGFMPSMLESNSNIILIDQVEFESLIENSIEVINTMAKLQNRSKTECAIDFAKHLQSKKILTQQHNWRAIPHGLVNYGWAGSNLKKVLDHTAISKVSGLSGWSYLMAQPHYYLSYMTVGGIFFAATHPLLQGTRFDRPVALLRDVFFIPTVVCESGWNLFINPVIVRVTGLDARFNLTSYLKFGPGIVATSQDYLPKVYDQIKGMIKNRL